MKAVPLPPLQQHPLPAIAIPKYVQTTAGVLGSTQAGRDPTRARATPAGPETGREHGRGSPTATARTCAGWTVGEAGPFRPKPVCPGSSEATRTQVQRAIQKGTGYQRAPAPGPPPGRRVTLRYIYDPAQPGLIAKPAAIHPWMLPPDLRGPDLPVQAKPAPPPAVDQPCAYQDYRKTTPAADRTPKRLHRPRSQRAPSTVRAHNGWARRQTDPFLITQCWARGRAPPGATDPKTGN